MSTFGTLFPLDIRAYSLRFVISISVFAERFAELEKVI